MPRFLFRRPNIVQRFMIHRRSKRGGKPKNELEPSDDVVSERLDTTEADFDPMYTMEPPMETAPVIECRDCSLGCKDPAVSYEEESAMRAPIAPGAYVFKNDDALESKLMTRSSAHFAVESKIAAFSNHQTYHYKQQSSSSAMGTSTTSRSFSTPSSSLNGMGAIEIEISLGHFAPLRGSQETMAAIQVGFSLKVICMCCEARLLCIADAEFVLCPNCKVVSPNYINDDSMRELVYGVGLGLLDHHY